ncbi:MAG: NADP-dependent malic enzyme, partial [Longimicrobiaceae bacterium]
MSDRRQDALDYHSQGPRGKIAVVPTKPASTQRDLSLAYSPGVAEPCREIARDPEEVFKYTARGNLVAVVSNGTAVLGLGNIGPLAAKPVMEGKAVLFKRFADIDVFDLEVGSQDPDDVIRFCELLEPTVGGINLEDIAAPECFYIEETLKARLDIPVFHDDQHGTAVVTLAALENALRLTDRLMETTRVVISGAGAAGVAVTRILLAAGVRDVSVVDRTGVLHSSRGSLNDSKQALAEVTADVTGRRGSLSDVMSGADVFIGVSGGTVDEEVISTMAPDSIIFGLANPSPEVHPEVAH